MNKKSISAIVAISLFIVLTVITVIGFQTWYNTYFSNVLNDIEQNDLEDSPPEINIILGRNLLVKGGGTNLSIDSVKIDGIDCSVPNTILYASEQNSLNLQSCFSNLTQADVEISILTNKSLITKNLYIKDFSILKDNTYSKFVRKDGGSNYDIITSVLQKRDGAFVLSGTSSNPGTQVWRREMSSNGELSSINNTFSGNRGLSSILTSDGGYAVLSEGGSFGLAKYDSDGQEEFSNFFSKNNYISESGFIELNNGSYMITGFNESNYPLLKAGWVTIDSEGSIDSTPVNLATDSGISEEFRTLIQDSDNNLVFLGMSNRSSGAGGIDIWVYKTTSSGTELWNQTYGGSGNEQGNGMSIIENHDLDGYLILSETHSFGAGSTDLWLFEINKSGSMIWNKTYGGASSEATEYWIRSNKAIIKTSDEGYAIGGYTNSFGNGSSDIWLIKTNSTGGHIWNQTYGGTGSDTGIAILQTPDDGFLIGGYTGSYGDTDGDGWVIKTDSLGQTCDYSGDGECEE